MQFVELAYLSGDRFLVFAPPILVARRVEAWHNQLLETIRRDRVTVYPINEAQELENFLGYYSDYYQAIAQLLDIQEVEKLDPISRHHFFVCTPPPEHLSQGQQKEVIVGLPKLKKLLGYQEIDPSQPLDQSLSTPAESTGSPELDILTNACLVFKGRAIALAKIMSAEELAKMVRFANYQMTPEKERQKQENVSNVVRRSNEEALSRIKGQASIEDNAGDDPRYTERAEEITAWLQRLNVELPEGW